MKTLPEQIAIMHAETEDEEIEERYLYNLAAQWKPKMGTYNWTQFDYRVKPKPIEKKIARCYDTGHMLVWITDELVNHNHTRHPEHDLVLE